MIDCHAHVFPSVEETARKLPGPFGGLLGMLARGARMLPKVPVDIERVASMRKKGNQPMQQAAEMILSVGLLPQVALSGALDDLSASMKKHGVTRTVVIAAPPTTSNAWLLEALRSDPARFVPVTTLPEVYGGDAQAWGQAFDALVAGGARGFKIHPNMDGRPADDPAYRALFEAAERHDRFVILHTGCFNVPGYKSYQPAHPDAFVPLFEAFPKVRVCLAHMNRDQPEAAWALMQRFPQLFADTSWQPADALRRAVDTVGSERIVLGSDWPLLHADLQGDAARVLERAVAGEAFERISRGNAAALLGSA